ncbi:hypothetical protein E3E23_00600 [Thermococcus sp. CX2]|uniref:McrC family protein n=1 Tax=Thermococcus sp. CX2 TaxID=163006 RepID=UPI00143AA4A7|nr:hypothetical protein [Thermococcus sp. CX2]NJE84346.1 hypothetical protein [Thermococcus sp. CX2]
MNIPPFFEHEKICYPHKKDTCNGKVLPDERLIPLIRELNKRYSKNEDRGVFILYKDYLQATSYVGFALLRGHLIQVLPKIYRNELEPDEEKRTEATITFLKMLDIAYGLRVHRLKERELMKVAQIGVQNGLHEAFIYLFGKTLLDEIKRGYYREYVEVQSEETYLRGKLLLSRQITKLPHQRHTFSVEYYDFTEDNLLNQIFYAATVVALKKTRLHVNKKLLGQLASLFVDVTPKRILRSHIERVHFTRLNERFKVPFTLAVIVLFGLGGISGTGAPFGFFVDMNTLFQRYIEEAIRRELSPQYVVEEAGIGELIKNSSKEVVPDVVIKRDGRIRLLVEVKYKKILEKTLVESRDVYQVYAYSRLADTDVVLIYPKRRDFNEKLTKQELEFFDGHRVVVLPFDLSEIASHKGDVFLPEEIKTSLHTLLNRKEKQNQLVNALKDEIKETIQKIEDSIRSLREKNDGEMPSILTKHYDKLLKEYPMLWSKLSAKVGSPDEGYVTLDGAYAILRLINTLDYVTEPESKRKILEEIKKRLEALLRVLENQ